GSTWTEQQKIVPDDEGGPQPVANFGWSVALSADGDTALIGGFNDDIGPLGAAWGYTRSGSSLSKQTKIVPPDESGGGRVGSAVALSADGNTAVIGGETDGSDAGAAWVYTRSATTWTKQQKIVPGDETGAAEFGTAVAVSSDGNT